MEEGGRGGGGDVNHGIVEAGFGGRERVVRAFLGGRDVENHGRRGGERTAGVRDVFVQREQVFGSDGQSGGGGGEDRGNVGGRRDDDGFRRVLAHAGETRALHGDEDVKLQGGDFNAEFSAFGTARGIQFG